MKGNGKAPERFEIRCVSADRFTSPVIDTATTAAAAKDKLTDYHEHTKTSLNRLGIFDTRYGQWFSMPQTLYAR